MTNALTVDVEDYFMVSAFSRNIPLDSWDSRASRIVGNTDRVLNILARNGVKGTFFVLGWVAQRFPELVKRIREEGHEIGCHSYNHRLVYDLAPEQFREDTKKAKAIIEDVTGSEVVGYRAPSYSITGRSLWALDILIELGFRYDSSIFPVRHDRYGIPGFSRFAGIVERPGGGAILEIPLSTLRTCGANFPFAGGGYLRLLPASFTEWGIRTLNVKEGMPAVVYVHPWELDPGQPRLAGNMLSVFRHYTNIDTTERKLVRLLQRFRFAPVCDAFRSTLPGEAAAS